MIRVDWGAFEALQRPNSARKIPAALNPVALNVDFKRCLTENAIYRCRHDGLLIGKVLNAEAKKIV